MSAAPSPGLRLSNHLAVRMTRHHLHYAWLVAALTFMTMLMMAAALGLPGALILPLGKEFGWTTRQISSALAIRFALYGLLGPFTALMIGRLGARTVMLAGLLLVGGSMALATVMDSLWQLFVLWGLVLGIGSGMTAIVLGAAVANHWFETQRGLVVGLLTASAATGQLLFLPLAAALISAHGWRAAVLPVVIGTVVVGLLVLLLMRNRPQDLGLQPFGSHPDSAAQANAANRLTDADQLTWRTPFAVLRQAMGVPTFWLLFGTFFICGLSTNGLIQTHFITLCSDRGMGAVPAAAALAMMGTFDLIGTIASGWLSDRYDNRKLLAVYYGLRGLSLFWLPQSAFSLSGLALFNVFYGLDWIATVPPTVRLTNQHFGPTRAAMVFGWVFAGHQLGSATAAYGAGWSRSFWLTYTPAIYAAACACVLAAGISLLITRAPGGQPA